MAENFTSKSTNGQNIVQQGTRDGATFDEGWSADHSGAQDGMDGAIVDEGQNSPKAVRVGATVDEGWSDVGENGPQGVRVGATVDEGRSDVRENGPQDVRIGATVDEGRLVVGENSLKDVRVGATADKGWSDVGENVVVKFLTPPVRDDAGVAVVMVPLPAQGHLNQLLHLSRIISMYNIHVHYIGITTHIQQAKVRAHGFDPLTITNIHFHELVHQTPSFVTPQPNPNASFKFPNHLIPSFYATSHLREPLCSLVRELLSANNSKVVVIYDDLMKWIVQDLPQIPNIECYSFNSTSAFFTYSYLWELKEKPFYPGTENYDDIPTIDDCFPPEFWEYVKIQEQVVGRINCGELYNSSRVIEGLYLDLMAKEYEHGMKQWAIGPFNPMESKNESKKRHECLDWLDKQERDSVIFVSFGTTTSLCDEEVKVLAIGLERSRQKFVWVLRDADKGDVFTGEVRRVELPEGYEERIRERGIIVRDWAPQLEILAHSSTGGFMSHCGWNSCMESMSFGVPIAAWPMHSDQPRNSQLVTKYLKIGLIVRPWARRDEHVTSERVDYAVKTLMASTEGDEMRKRAAELSNSIKKSVTDGGINSAEMDSFIAHITR